MLTMLGAVDFQSNYGSTIFLSAEESRLLAIGDEEALGLTMAKSWDITLGIIL